MAELARREAERGGCLLHMVKSHPQPLRFLPALVSQAARLAGVAFGPAAYVGDVDDLRNSLLRALEAVRARAGRAVVVLDALDELDAAGAGLTFLPRSLPEGVRMVLSCRPDIPLATALRERLRGCLEERALEPLTEADFRLLLERRLEAGVVRGLQRVIDFGAVFRRLGGNPLFLHCVVDDLGERWALAAREGRPLTVSAESLPATLEAAFRGIYDRVRNQRPGEATAAEGRQRARLLQLLCVAREPLELEQLAGLTAADDRPLLLEELRDRVEEMSQWLLEVGRGRFKPWHQGLVDYVRRDVLGLAGVRSVEGTFCRWLEAEGGLYPLRRRVSHLIAAGRAGDAAALLLDLPFLEAKAGAGLLFGLTGEFTAVAEALPQGDPPRDLLGLLEEALRRDLHFLARRPSCLFQCLWNSCWWYDCAEAAAHFRAPEQDGGAESPPWARPGPKLAAVLEQWRAVKEPLSGVPLAPGLAAAGPATQRASARRLPLPRRMGPQRLRIGRRPAVGRRHDGRDGPPLGPPERRGIVLRAGARPAGVWRVPRPRRPADRGRLSRRRRAHLGRGAGRRTPSAARARGLCQRRGFRPRRPAVAQRFRRRHGPALGRAGGGGVADAAGP